VEVGSAPFDPGPSHYDSRRAKRARRREEKAERKRRARAEKLERERRARVEKLEREKRARAEQLEREKRARADEVERKQSARAERLELERAERLERERLERAEELERRERERERARAERERQERERRRALAAEREREQEQRARLEAERREAERLARVEAERRARAEAERRAKLQAERRRPSEPRRRTRPRASAKPVPAEQPRPIRLGAAGGPKRRAKAAPLTGTRPPGSRSLKRPTAKAGFALAVVIAAATGLGSLLGLPVPLPSSGSPEQSRAALSSDAALIALDSGTPVELTEGPYHPVVGTFGYGEAAAKFHADRGGRKHEGQDVFAETGTPLVAVRDGIVLDGAGGRNFYASGGGHTAVIYSRIDNRSYVYLHMHKPALVKAGEEVTAGQPIGQLGCTGSCDGPHLHFEVRRGRADWGAETKAIDPLPLLKGWPQRPTGP